MAFAGNPYFWYCVLGYKENYIFWIKSQVSFFNQLWLKNSKYPLKMPYMNINYPRILLKIPRTCCNDEGLIQSEMRKKARNNYYDHNLKVDENRYSCHSPMLDSLTLSKRNETMITFAPWGPGGPGSPSVPGSPWVTKSNFQGVMHAVQHCNRHQKPWSICHIACICNDNNYWHGQLKCFFISIKVNMTWKF